MAPLSARAKSPSVKTGDVPKKWASFNSFGAQCSVSLWYRLISYGTWSSSWVGNVEELQSNVIFENVRRTKSQSIRWERELSRWWTVRTIVGETGRHVSLWGVTLYLVVNGWSACDSDQLIAGHHFSF